MTQHHDQRIKDNAQVGVAVSGDAKGTVANISIENAFVLPEGISLEQLARLAQAPAAHQQRWQERIDDLCALALHLATPLLVCLHAAVWSHAALPACAEHDGAALFRSIIRARHGERPHDTENILLFIDALKNHTDAQQRALLASWLSQADAAHLRASAPYQERRALVDELFTSIQQTSASLLIEIRSSRLPQGSTPTYRVRAGVTRPVFGTRMLFPNGVGEERDLSLAEIKQLIGELLQSDRLPVWAVGTPLIELLLPLPLLKRLSGVWRGDAWRYDTVLALDEETSIPARKRLDELCPLVVRLSNRARFAEQSGAPWADKWRYLTNWLHDAARHPTPRLVYGQPDHPHYVDADAWREQIEIVGLVQPEPLAPDAPPSADHWLTRLLCAGLPVAVWLAPDARLEHCAAYLQGLFEGTALRNLPLRLWRERQQGQAASPAADLVLFWDQCDRELPEAPLSAS